MAISSMLIGGFSGFLSFLVALFGFDSGVLAAFGIYISFAFGTTALVLLACFLPKGLQMGSSSQPAA